MQCRKVTYFNIAGLFPKVQSKIQNGQIAINGFKTAGIYFFVKDIFTDADFMNNSSQGMYT